MHPFIKGESYDREDILDFIGSKQQVDGIVYDKDNPGRDHVAIFTGSRHGKKAGYEDGWGEGEDDGIYLYCGRGRKGHQELRGANEILASHRGIVLLFETWMPHGSWKGKQRFVGEFHVLGEPRPQDGTGDRKGDRLLIFRLIPVEKFERTSPSNNVNTSSSDFSSLRADAIAAGRPISPAKQTISEYRSRAEKVARYILSRANGTCEACAQGAPFNKVDGTPYLEVHHVYRLADDGPDDIMHVAAVCPNCHAEAHHGPDITGFRERLGKSIADKEEALGRGTLPTSKP